MIIKQIWTPIEIDKIKYEYYYGSRLNWREKDGGSADVENRI